MALLKGKFVSKDEAIQSNNDPTAAEDLSRKSYVDSQAASAASAAVDAKVIVGPMEIAFGSPDGTTLDRSEFLTYDASVGFLLNVGGQMATRSLAQDAVDPQSVIVNDKVEVFGDDGTGPAYSRVRRDYVEAKKVESARELSASLGYDGTESWVGVSETTNTGNNISMAKIFPNKAQLFTVDIAAGTGPQPILPTVDHDLVVKKYVDDGLAGKADLVGGKVPAEQLPSYVDDVIEVADYASLPATGEADKIYITIDTNKVYRWSGSTYIEIVASPGSTDAVPEGSTNLYFTNERAKAAAVTNEIVDGVIDVAPSQEAVHTALAGKQASLGTGTTSQYLRGDLTWHEVATSVGIAQTKIVTKGGSDVTGDGTFTKPFASIGAAMASITDASPTKRYIIKVEAGAYTESALTLKANVFIVGDLKEAVRITATSLSLDSSFTGTADNRSGLARVIINNAVNFDWAAVTSGGGKIYCTEVSFSSTLNLNGYNNAMAQAQFNDCVMFGLVTISGINVGVFKDNFVFNNITLNQHSSLPSIINIDGGTCGTLRFNASVNDFNRRSAGFIRNFQSENLIVDGPSAYADYTLESGSKTGAQSLNGGNLVPLTPKLSQDLETKMLKPIANNAHNSGDWGKQWFFNFAYVHASAGTDMYVTSVMETYDSAGDTVGRSVFVQADGYGLQANVNGGNIELETAAVSGTGVRGKVQVKAKELDMTSTKIVNVADPTSAQDAATKKYVDDGIAGIDLGSKIEDSITDGVTDKAPSQNAVYDALAGKANSSHTHIAADITDFNTAAQSALSTQLAGKQDSLGTGTTSQYLRGDLTWAEVPAALTPKKEVFVLTSTDLSNAYLDCAHVAAADSMLLMTGGIPHQEGASEDYTLSTVGGVTRISINSGLLAKLSVGDRVYVMYQK